MDSEQNVRPVEYTVRLEPEFETDSFTGSVSFTLTEALADTTALVINCARIQIREALYRIGDRDEKWIPLEYSFDEDRETISLTFPTAIPRGRASTVRFGYVGRMEDNMEGLYKASYTDPKTAAVHQMAVTQMQANCARRVFPCFDEPAFKATFAVELVVPDGDRPGEGTELVCLGNMPIARTESITIDGDKKEQKKKKLVVFEKTPNMSTYLIAVAVGRLECIRSDSGRVPIAAWSPPGLREQTAFALQVAVRALALYEALFQIPYPLPKLDMLAVPDFSIGAMENWGLITFRTSCLCVDPVRSAVWRRRAVAETVAHELSHSWFGNLVTLDSWDGLWLNEGFASWMEMFAAKQLFPEWPVWEDYVADTLQLALNCDSLPSTHPVEMRIRDATEVDQVFDTISYQKGSCMVTMIAEDLGQDVFMAGVRAYLRRHAYGNASTAQLWQALAEASGRDVSAHMSVWTLTAGFPVITVREDEGGQVLRLHKRRFLSYRDPAAAPEEEKEGGTYPLPLKIRTRGAGGRVETMVVDFPGADVAVTLPAGTTAYKLNPDQNAFLRTAYPASYLAALPEGLLSVRDRVGIVADAAALAVTGDGSTAGLLDLLVTLGAVEEEYVVWMQIAATLGKIRFAWVFADQRVFRGLRRLTREVAGRKFRQLGWALGEKEADGGGGGGSVEEQFKALMFGVALAGKDPQATEATRDMFARYVAGDQAAIHPGLKSEVFGAAVRNGGEAEFDALWHIYRTTESEDDKLTALFNMGMAIEPSLLRKLFDRVLGPDVKAQDFTHPLCCIPGSAPGARLLIDWARTNWATIEAALTPSLMANVVAVATNCLESGAELDEFVNWAARQEGYKTYDKAVRENTERARARRAWPDRCGDEVEAWLEAKGWLEDADV